MRHTPGRSDQQTNYRWRHASQKRLDNLVVTKSLKAGSGSDRHDERRKENTDGCYQRAEDPCYSIADKGRSYQNWTRSDLAQRSGIDKLLVGQPVITLDCFRFDQRNHDIPATESYR